MDCGESLSEIAGQLRQIVNQMDKDAPCVSDGDYYCRVHYDTDLCASCRWALELDRLHRSITGKWMHEIASR